MKNRAIILTAILLLTSITNYFTIISNGTIRSVEFISIFAIGILSGMLLFQIVLLKKSKN